MYDSHCPSSRLPLTSLTDWRNYGSGTTHPPHHQPREFGSYPPYAWQRCRTKTNNRTSSRPSLVWRPSRPSRGNCDRTTKRGRLSVMKINDRLQFFFSLWSSPSLRLILFQFSIPSASRARDIEVYFFLKNEEEWRIHPSKCNNFFYSKAFNMVIDKGGKISKNDFSSPW